MTDATRGIRAARRFETTRWSLVVSAADASDGTSRRALDELCRAYWYPVYAFARRSGRDTESARDLTQGFFAELLEKGYLGQADRARGRFRTFLLTAFRHHASKDRERESAIKRGGGVEHVALELDYDDGERRYRLEASDAESPERAFERRWALELLSGVLRSLRDDYRATGKGAMFDLLEPSLSHERGSKPFGEVAAEVGMSEAAVKVAAYRMRRRYRDRLRAAIQATVADPEDVDDELRHLRGAVAR